MCTTQSSAADVLPSVCVLALVELVAIHHAYADVTFSYSGYARVVLHSS